MASQDPNFGVSESPLYVGRAIASLAADTADVSPWLDETRSDAVNESLLQYFMLGCGLFSPTPPSFFSRNPTGFYGQRSGVELVDSEVGHHW